MLHIVIIMIIKRSEPATGKILFCKIKYCFVKYKIAIADQRAVPS